MNFFQKILIANRGEIAVRIIRTAERLNIKTVAIYADDDRDSLHVELADEAILLKGSTLIETYLNHQKIIEIALQCGVDAIHPGYGFLSENPNFAEFVESQGLIFIGAISSQIALMGNKTRAIEFVKELDIPIIPSIQGNLTEIQKLVEKLQFPVLVKAIAGGGGKGMQIVNRISDLNLALKQASRQALTYFGNEELFVEQFFPKARHIEVQIFGDGNGNVVHLFERECSIQRNYQKIIEEAPAESISDSLKEKLYTAATQIAVNTKYRGAGTIEFLVDEKENFFFLEMNTRLQVEHPVTEMITGVDLVEWQLYVAANGSLPLTQSEIKRKGNAIELRICAEDPMSDFKPSSGYINRISGSSIRFDHYLKKGMQLSSNYDSLLGKLIAYGKNREEAILKLESAAKNLFISGVKTNLPFLLHTIAYRGFIENKLSTRFVESHLADFKLELIKQKKTCIDPLALIVYVIYHFYPVNEKNNHVWCRSNLNQLDGKYSIELDDQMINLELKQRNFGIEMQFLEQEFLVSDITISKDKIQFVTSEITYLALIAEQNGFSRVQIRGYQVKLRSNYVLSEAIVNKKSNHSIKESRNHVFADLFGKVLEIPVVSGESVTKNQLLLIIESMKTEFRILSPVEGKVKYIHIEKNSLVQDKQLLVELEIQN